MTPAGAGGGGARGGPWPAAGGGTAQGYGPWSITQVFGNQPFDIALPRRCFTDRASCEGPALSRCGAMPCTIDGITRCYCHDFTYTAASQALRRERWRSSVPSSQGHRIPRYGTILYCPAGTPRRPPTTRLGAVPTSVNRDTRPRSGTLVGAHRAGAHPAPDKSGCQIDVRRASVDASTFHALLQDRDPHKGSNNHGARIEGGQQKGRQQDQEGRGQVQR